MQKKIIIATVLFVGAYFMQSCSNSTDTTTKTEMDSSMNHKEMNNDNMKMDNPMMESMSSTMGKIKDMKMTGDFDLDFANMMMMHHQGAIDMSEVQIAKGSDEQIKSMAKNIISSQKAEIEELQAFVKNYKMPETKMEDGEMHNELGETMKAGMDKMQDMPMSGNTDKDFVMMMIPHHESAVAMAKDELSLGKQASLKKMAQKMIADQTKEIGEFKAWSSKQK